MEGCKYCIKSENQCKEIIKDSYTTCRIDYDYGVQLYSSSEDDAGYGKINYCPMCGRKLNATP